jgi:hypothetical protein
LETRILPSFASPLQFAAGPVPPYGIVHADMNGDGKTDLVVTNRTGDSISVLLGNGDGTFGAPITTSTGTGSAPEGLAVGDVNGDGIPDIVTADAGSNGITVLLGKGDGTFAPPLFFAAGQHTDSVALGDFNGDGKLDIAATNYESNTISIFTGDGTGNFTLTATYGTGGEPDSVVTADFNHDGKADLAVTDFSGDDVQVFLGKGDGTFLSPLNNPTPGGSQPDALAVGDFNGDGKLDLVYANYGSDNISVLLGNGDGTFGSHIDTPVNLASGSPGSVAVADFNGDGRLDVVVGSVYDSVVTLLDGNGDGTFQAPQQFATGPASTFVTVADFNGDGLPDVAAADAGTAPGSIPNEVTVLDSSAPTGDSLSLSGPTSVEPGVPFSLTVSAVNASDAVDPDFIGTVDLTSTDADFVPVDHTFTTADMGSFTFTITLNTPGNQTVTATDVDNNLTTPGSQTIAVGKISPAFADLVAPTITYGTASTTVSGQLDGTAGGQGVPAGESVSVVLNGVTQTAILDNNQGFSTTFATGALSAAGSPYTISLSYGGDSEFTPISGSTTLTVQKAATSVTVPEVDVAFSGTTQVLTLNATVLSPSGAVNDGTVTFTVLDAADSLVGSPVASGTVAGGAASAGFTLPAGQAAGVYTVEAVYSGDVNLQTGPGSGSLGVDTAPSLDPIDGTNLLSAPSNQFPLSVPLSGTSTINKPLNFTATATGDNPLFDLEQQYQFTGVGYFTAGAPAYVLHSSQSGPGVAGYYLLSPSGGLYAYDGSGSYAHTFANSANLVTTLAPGIYTDPTQLLNAAAPVDYTTLYNLEQQYQFTGLGYFTAGAPAYVLHSSRPGPGVLGYYLLSPDGDLFPYDGSGSYAGILTGSSPLATPGPGVYSDPAELTGAGAPAAMSTPTPWATGRSGCTARSSTSSASTGTR